MFFQDGVLVGSRLGEEMFTSTTKMLKVRVYTNRRIEKKEIPFCSQSVVVNGVTMAPHLKKPAAAGCLTRFPSLITEH